MIPELPDDLEALRNYSGPDRVISSTEMRERLKDAPALQRYDTGIGKLDILTGGIVAGELIAIGGPTKMGKTLLAQTITRNLVDKGVNVLWFSFEVPIFQFLGQMPEHLRFYVPSKLEVHNIEWLFKRAIEAKLKFSAKVMFIDNLHHLFDLATTRNPSLDIGVMIRRLKRMAIAMDMVIFILCHSRKPAETRGLMPEVSEWDLRDSSFIPQEADTTWMMQRKIDKELKKFTDKSFVKVCNHRRTGTMGEIVHLVKVGQLFEEDVTVNG